MESVTDKQKQRLICASWFILVVLIIFVNMIALSSVRTKPPKVQYFIEGADEAINRMKSWPDVVKASRIPGRFGNNEDPRDADIQFLQNCWSDDNWLRMYIDPYCNFLWMAALEQSTITSLDNIIGVITQQERKEGEEAKSNQNGGMRCTMNGHLKDIGIQGYWKPCTMEYLPFNSETFKSEIIAFHIDRILGFYRTPPVVPVYLPREKLYSLARDAAYRNQSADPSAIYKVQTVMDKCGTLEGAEGAMVGWNNFPIRPLDITIQLLKSHRVVNMITMDKKELEEVQLELFNITSESQTSSVTWALENVSLNMFAILTGNQRKFAHSIFAIEKTVGSTHLFGPLLYVDNDRSSWDSDVFAKLISKDHPLTHICKFPIDIATRILAINETSGFTVGNLLKDALSHYSSTFKETPLFTEANARWIDQRVKFLRDTIEKCIHNHGVENVLIREPWYYDFVDDSMWSHSINKEWIVKLYENYNISESVSNLITSAFSDTEFLHPFSFITRTDRGWRISSTETIRKDLL